ncbi:MAG: phosphatidylglycerol lysyltransferase domain-containing protein [Oscillospiraceae bacterium]|nr:phosphatidylglycerol lysyltransferase domain-containing protein [Oscillospiraceae bacterium]
MIEFQAPQLEDKPWVDALLAQSQFQGCEYTFTNLFLWSQLYQTKITQLDGFLLAWFQRDEGCHYLLPAGQGDLKRVMEKVRQDRHCQAQPLRLSGVTGEGKERLDTLFPGRFLYEHDPGLDDYLYRAERLATLAGKKLHGKRNHINRFMTLYPDWSVEPLRADNVKDCWTVEKAWAGAANQENLKDGTEAGEEAKGESRALRLALCHQKELGLEGAVLRVAGQPVAFTLGGRLNRDTFDVHFEKAIPEVQGAFPMINREFVRMILERYPEIHWINREEDLGLPGLRQAKRSYDPDGMVVKYRATLQGEAPLWTE